ncbi:Imm1 family immunity protein [Lentzea sp. NPDC042327]|uniref:Imm1 family immunity protein n=1 Tax=Lentzea sp. NPDC042327 TaxID=3154801 RepID=UPI0033D28C32
MALEVWWNSDATEPTRVESPEELWALLDQARGTVDYPIMFEVLDADDPYQGSILDVGLHKELGALYFSGPQAEHGCYTLAAPSSFEQDLAERVYFDHMNQTRDFPPSSLYPIDVIRRAVVQFAESNGQLPDAVAWQPASAISGDSEA